MKDMGMEKIIFSKDNTLTLPGKSNFIDEQVRNAFHDVTKTFGTKNVLIISNLTEPKIVHELKGT